MTGGQIREFLGEQDIQQGLGKAKENYQLTKDNLPYNETVMMVDENSTLYKVEISHGRIISISDSNEEDQYDIDEVEAELDSGATLGAAITSSQEMQENITNSRYAIGALRRMIRESVHESYKNVLEESVDYAHEENFKSVIEKVNNTANDLKEILSKVGIPNLQLIVKESEQWKNKNKAKSGTHEIHVYSNRKKLFRVMAWYSDDPQAKANAFDEPPTDKSIVEVYDYISGIDYQPKDKSDLLSILKELHPKWKL